MSGRTAGLAGLCLGAAVAYRRVRGRRLARRITGSGPSVRTDDGVRLTIDVTGREDAAVTVVLAHGFAARSSMFDPQVRALRAHARVVRYDQRGHGRSGWAGYRSTTVDRLGRDLGQVVDEVAGPGPVVLVGHSMGGMAVLALAGQRPELFGDRVAGVALLSTRAAPLAADGGGVGALLRVRTVLARAGAWLLWLASPLLSALQPFRSRPGRAMLRRRLFAGDPPDGMARAVEDMWAETPTAVLTAYLPALARYDERAAAAAVGAVPVLVLAGAKDGMISPRAAERLADRIAGQVRTVVVPGAGHMVTLTHAHAVNAELLDLVARARGASAERRAS